MEKDKDKDKKNLGERITLFAAILKEQYDSLRFIAYKERKSLAEVTREAIDTYLKTKKIDLKEYKEKGHELSLPR
jgi:hypothetical protein